MAKQFTVSINNGQAQGPYAIYYDTASSSNYATVVSTGTSASNITYAELIAAGGVRVSVPDSATKIILFNTDPSCNVGQDLILPTPGVTSTPTVTPTFTVTPVPATDTPTPTATSVPATDTPTPVPATDTPTPTATSVPATDTPTPTATSVPPTDTPTPTPTIITSVPPTVTPTPTPTIITSVPPTVTPTPTPTDTAIPFTDTPTPTPEPVVCYEYDLYSDGGDTVTFVYTDCITGQTLNPTVPNGDGIGVCARETNANDIFMSPNTGTVIQGVICSGGGRGALTATPTPVPNTSTPTPTPIPNTSTPTPVPQAQDTSTPTPVPNTSTPTPTPIVCYECGDGWQSLSTSNYSYGTYADVAVCSTDGASNTLYWSVLDRPNRINVYSNGSLDYTSGWQGTANYTGPWGSSLNTASTGNASFTWGSTSNRLVRIEYGPADSSNQIADAVEFNIVCDTSATATPTPTPTQYVVTTSAPPTYTPTPTPTEYVVTTSAPPTYTPTPTPTATVVASATDTPTPVPSYNYYFVRGCPSTFYENQDMVIRTYSTLPDANGFPSSSSVIYHNGGSFYAYSTTNATAWNNNEGDLNSITYSGTVDTGCPNIATATPVPNTSTPTPVPATATPTPVPGVPSETLGDGATNTDACNDFVSGTGTVRYLDDFFPFATVIYRFSDGTGNAAAGYYSDGGVWRYWNGSAFTSNGDCAVYGGQL
jgi:hypothetical protein